MRRGRLPRLLTARSAPQEKVLPLISRDEAGAREFVDGGLEGEHSVRAARLHDGSYLVTLPFAYEVGDRRNVEEDFGDGRAPLAVGAREQGLRDDAPQALREHG